MRKFDNYIIHFKNQNVIFPFSPKQTSSAISCHFHPTPNLVVYYNNPSSTFASKMLSAREYFVSCVWCLITFLFSLFLSSRHFFSPRIREMAVFRSRLNPVDSCSEIRCLIKRRFSKAFLPPISDFPETFMTRDCTFVIAHYSELIPSLVYMFQRALV